MLWRIQKFGLMLTIGMLLGGCSGANQSSGGGSGGSGGGGTGSATLAQVGSLGATYSGGSWVVAGEGGFTLLANGTGFTSSSVIQWNATSLTTQFGSSTDINAPVTAAMIAQPGTVSITVHDTAANTTTAALPFGIASPAAATAGVIALITVAPGGAPANNNSLVEPSISATGRYVSFQSSATNLGAGITSGYQQIYERDTCIGAPSGCLPSTIPISVTYDGSPVDNPSRDSSVSDDGRYVAFDSQASNIIASEPSFCYSTPGDVCAYLRDTCVGATSECTPSTTLVSSLLDGEPAGGGNPTISPDGRYVGYNSTGTSSGTNNVYLTDTCNSAPAGCVPGTILISQSSIGVIGDTTSGFQDVNSGGRYVSFVSYAKNLLSSTSNAGNPDLFLRDTCISAPAACIPTTLQEDVSTSGVPANGGALDTFSNPSISSDGRFLSFTTLATNLVTQNVNGYGNVYLRDTCNGATVPCTPSTVIASLGNDGSISNAGENNSSISATGRFVAFASLASNLVPGDTFGPGGWKDIFVRDTCFGSPAGCTPGTVRVSVSNSTGFAVQSNGINDYPRISKDGHYVVFLSASTNYLSVPGNGYDMVFIAKTGW
jgi:Tol biopolymer transport system component